MALLVDIQSKMFTPFLVNLEKKDFNLVPGLAGTVMARTLQILDKKSGQTRGKSVRVHCPPAITFPARGVVKGLPAAVLRHPVIASMLLRTNGRRPKLLIKRQYDPDASKAKTAPPPTATPTRPKATRRGGKNRAAK